MELTDKAKEFIFTASAWEDSDCIVTIRHQDDEPWKDIPIGQVLDRANARVVADWLNNGGLATLWKIASNIMKEENNES